MPYLILAILAIGAILYGSIRTVLKKRKYPSGQSLAAVVQTQGWQIALAGIGMTMALLLGAVAAAALFFLFMLLLILLGVTFLFLHMVQKKNAAYCATGMSTVAKQGGQFFMTLLALFIEFILNFAGAA